MIYRSVNNGVYRSGFARPQEAYHEAVTDIFRVLDGLDQRLASRRYLMGPILTEADVRLRVTLARFDAVYYSHFKANLRRVTDYQNLRGDARAPYPHPPFLGTPNLDPLKRA